MTWTEHYYGSEPMENWDADDHEGFCDCGSDHCDGETEDPFELDAAVERAAGIDV